MTMKDPATTTKETQKEIKKDSKSTSSALPIPPETL